MCGVRPNSPVTISSTRLSRPRSYKSSINAVDRPVVHRKAESAVVEDVAIDGVRIPVVGRVGRERLAGERRILHHHGDEAGPRFDQPPGQQGPLAVTVHAVAFAHLRGSSERSKARRASSVVSMSRARLRFVPIAAIVPV